MRSIAALGDSGDGWEGAFDALSQKVRGVRFVHPTAPEQPVSCQGGMRMTSWFDIKTWNPMRDQPIGLAEPDNPAGMEETIRIVHQELEAIERSGIPANKVVLGGFSQGGTVSLLAGLSYPRQLGGIVSISGWTWDSLPTKANAASSTAPVLFCYGKADPVVDCALAKKSAELVKSVVGENATVMEVSRGDHSPSGAEMAAVLDFMARSLA